MRVLFFLFFMTAMFAVLMAQEAVEGEEVVEEKCTRGESIKCIMQCVMQGLAPGGCSKANGTVSCVCNDSAASSTASSTATEE